MSVADDLDVGAIVEDIVIHIAPLRDAHFGEAGATRESPPPISFTDSGMEMLVRLEQPEKALLPISVTDGGMMVFLHPLIRVLLSVWIMALQSSLES